MPKNQTIGQNLTGGQKLLYGAGLLVGLAVILPVTAFALMAITNIVVAGILFVALAGGIIALPMLNRLWRTMVLKAMKETARRNPVETLQQELIGRKKAFDEAGSKVVAINARCASLREKLDEYKEKHGQSDEALEKMYTKLSELAGRLKTSLKQTAINLEKFEDFVARQADRWEIAKETGDLAALLRETQGGDVTDKFLADTAIESIRNEVNMSFAEIDQILEGEEVQALIDEQPKQIPAPAMREIELVPLKRS